MESRHKKRARKQPQGQLPHVQAQRRRRAGASCGTTRCQPSNAQHMEEERDALRCRRNSFQPTRGASASHEPIEAREPRCNDPVPRSRSTQSSRQSLHRRMWRQVANTSSKGTERGALAHVGMRRRRRKMVEVQAPIRITTVRSRGTQVHDNTQNTVHDLSSETSGPACWPMRQPRIRSLCRQGHMRQLQ